MIKTSLPVRYQPHQLSALQVLQKRKKNCLREKGNSEQRSFMIWGIQVIGN